ncbi:deoxycytidylate deaminase-like [Lineus longissimus]|uniref:deoxycytidylate deaminase-like n=1 Tax=Lineus longissimus TaxID=88925 RepID=UPI002B4F123A
MSQLSRSLVSQEVSSQREFVTVVSGYKAELNMAEDDSIHPPETATEDDQFYLSIAAIVASKSKLTEKVGAVLVNDKRKIVGYGYNGSPLNHPTPGPIVVDAHTNAIIFATAPLEGTTMYTTHFPNAAAAAHVAQAEIKQIRCLHHQHGPSNQLPSPDIGKILSSSRVYFAIVRLQNQHVTINFADFGRVEPDEVMAQPQE